MTVSQSYDVFRDVVKLISCRNGGDDEGTWPMRPQLHVRLRATTNLNNNRRSQRLAASSQLTSAISFQSHTRTSSARAARRGG